MKKAISILLCLCLALSVFTVVPFAASAAEVTEESVGATSGTTVDCTWALDDNDTLTISGYGAMGDYSSQKLNGTWITTAPWGANIKTVIIEDGVTYIGSYAFYGCTGLTSVTIPDSVTSIGSNSFYGCTGLTSITIPDSLANIEGYAFNNTAWYNNQPDGMVYAGRVTYSYKGTMPDNTSIIIRDGTKGIAGFAFMDCTGLTSVSIPDSVTSIGDVAFSGCTGLTSVTIPDSVTSIGDYAFDGCTGLTSVIIPDSVTSIGYYSLGYNLRLKKIDGFTIYGVPGSAAEQYANDNGFEFIAVNLLECPNCHAALVIDAAVPPTYTATGLTEGLHCSVCGEVIMAQEILPKKPIDFTYGDLNGDDVVNVTDVTSVQRYLANLQTLTEQELGAADVNTDGKVTIDDVTLLQRYLAEFDVTIG